VTHGALTVAGLVSMGIGLATLFHNLPSPYHTSVPLVVSITVLIGGFWAFAISKAVAARRQPVSVGPQEIIGMEGVVRDGGLVYVRGELWQVHSPEPLKPGQHVLVDGLDGLALNVHPV
jgi:membrane-bound serine protease (ClpP class)